MPGACIGAWALCLRFSWASRRASARRGQRIRARQGAVGEQESAVGTEGETVPQAFLGLGRTHRDGHHLVGWLSFQGHGTRHPQTVEGVDLRGDALPENGLRRSVKVYLCHTQDVLHADGTLHLLVLPGWQWHGRTLRLSLACLPACYCPD